MRWVSRSVDACLYVSVAILLLVVAVTVLSGASDSGKSSAPREICADNLTLRSEKYTVSLSAQQNGIAGLWISNKGTSTPCAVVYLDSQYGQGPVMGVYSKDGNALAAAVCVQDGEGAIQLIDKGGNPCFLTASDLLFLKNTLHRP